MPEKRPRRHAAEPARPRLTSTLPVTVLAEADYTELKVLLERYEQLLCDWEDLSHRALKVLARCSQVATRRPDAVRHP